MTRRRAWTAAALAGALVVLASACAPDDRVTLDDLGAADLAGLNGPTMSEHCDEIPHPDLSRSSTCGRGPTTGEANVPLTPGDYAVVLFCVPPGSYRLEATRPADAFDAIEVDCSDGDDPAISPRFTVPEGGVESMHETFDGEGRSMTMLFSVPDGV